MTWPASGLGGNEAPPDDGPPIFDPPVLGDVPPTGSGLGATPSGGGGTISPTLSGAINYTNMIVGYFKINLEQTVTNIYGESLEKWYYPPQEVKCLLERGDYTNPTDEFGVEIAQTLTVRIIKDQLLDLNFMPEVGDIVTDQERFYEVNTLNTNIITIPGVTAQNATPGGTSGEIMIFVLTCHLTRTTKLNIREYYQ